MPEQLRKLAHPPSEALVEMLEALLKEAREGKLQTILVAGVRSNGEIVSGWSGHNNFAKVLGAFESAKYDFIKASNE
jgi:hypothetical protein